MRSLPSFGRRAFLKAIGSAALLSFVPRRLLASTAFRRRRPSDLDWPSKAAWQKLSDTVGGNLIPVKFPLSVLKADPASARAKRLWESLRNPYFVQSQPGLSETLGWVDAWTSKPSVYAVVARSAQDIAAGVNFARENNLRLVVKGAGHSYLGTSNAPDSLLIWTKHMNDIEMHSAFVPQGCAGKMQPQPAVTVGAGTIWMEAYEAVTTKGGRYVQGGGCTTVGVAGLVQGGGFGSYSKHYGLAAASLLEAEVVTADGQIRVANACTNSDLFWALKGGGGGTFGIVSRFTLRTHELPEFFGSANFRVKAKSDDAYRRLIREFVSFYNENLFNDHWGEQAHFGDDNTLGISMVSYGLDEEQSKKTWAPFFDWVKRSSHHYSLEGRAPIVAIPARHFWDAPWWKAHWPEVAFPRNGNPLHALVDDILLHVMSEPVFNSDNLPGASPDNFWWKGTGGEVAWCIWAYESQWIPASLLGENAQQRLADALFAASRRAGFALHFNKGLAGAPADAIAASRDTATNPAVLNAFALAITAAAQNDAYPGIPGHEPSIATGREAALAISACIDQLRAATGETGSYLNETNYFQKDWQQAFWGSNYQRLAAIKKKYDPEGLFFVHHGVGSDQWSRDGFTRVVANSQVAQPSDQPRPARGENPLTSPPPR